MADRMNKGEAISPLLKTVTISCTEYWNDSCAVDDLRYAISHGATGATSNPAIVLSALRKDLPTWTARAAQIASENPSWGETEISWQIIREISVRGAAELAPIFDKHGGKKGRLSLQTNPQLYRDSDAMLAQALQFHALARNMMVKLPATRAGIRAIEEATYRGVSINATVSFTVSQAIAVAEAVERGLARREKEFGACSTDGMQSVCTMMVGRLDDWLHLLEKRDGVVVWPGVCDWAGIAAIKHAAEIYKQRAYRAKLLAAAFRHHLHWSELVGGDVILTITCEWARVFNSSDVVPDASRFAAPVPEEALRSLREHFPAEFARAYDERGLSVEEFDTYAPTVRTLRTFVAAYHDLLGVVRDMMLPDPDNIKRT